MPIYEYRCKKCEQRFELMRRLADRTKRAKCEHCGSTATALAISAFAIVGSSDFSSDRGDFGDLDGMGDEDEMGGMPGMPDMGGGDFGF